MEFTVAGKKVFAATGGRAFDPRLPVVLFLHGAGMDHSIWMLQARYFAHHGRAVLATDAPGHGRSAGPGVRDMGVLADWALAVLDAAGAGKAALVGHSMGSLIALEAASRAPSRVTALALLGTAAPMKVHPDLQKSAEANDHGAIDLISSWALGRRAHFGGAQAPGTWMMGGGTRLLERNPPGALAAGLAACNAYGGAVAAAEKVTCPTLLLLGEADRMTPPSAAREIGAKIKGARTIVLPRAGHMMMIEQPDPVIDALATIV